MRKNRYGRRAWRGAGGDKYPVDHGRAPAIRRMAGAVRPGLSREEPQVMKKLLATALFSLVVLGMGAHQAFAFGCGSCSYKCCAAQYNAFSPFCSNVVMKKKLFCRKCCYVADQPCCM